MIYLIRTFGRTKNKRALKIGFSNDINTRLSNYYHQNPFYEPITTRCGDLYFETKIHLYLEALGYKQSFLNEWFLDIPEVLTEFHTAENKMDKVIWRNRNNLFSKEDFRASGNKLKKRIYEDLRMLFYDSRQITEIDKNWSIVMNKQLLKNMRSNNNIIF